MLQNTGYVSKLANQMELFIRQKKDNGYETKNYIYYLHEFDRLLVKLGDPPKITVEAIEEWDKQKPELTTRTKIARHNIIRMFCIYVQDRNPDSYVPDTSCLKGRCTFVPYVFSREQMHHIITVADNLPYRRNARLRHLIIPTAIRLLYGCGYRTGELLNMRIKDIDMETGVSVVTGKGGKMRYVVIAPNLLVYLRRYVENVMSEIDSEWLFPCTTAFEKNHYSRNSLYANFRELTYSCGIQHGGRSHGPRLHDLRHTFAVHSLENQLRQGYEPMEIIPRLAAYMGHSHYKDTLYYLHLTEDIYPDLTKQIEQCFGTFFPKGAIKDEEN